MAKLRKIQFYRNGEAEPIVNSEEHNVSDLKSAYVYAEAMFKQTGKHNEMEDGEILLYRFSYAGQVHTLVGVVHAEAGSKSLEVLANYDMLGAEISNEIAAAIAKLNGSATIATVADNVVTLKAGIVQTDGKVSQGEGADIVLEKVAKTGKAEDVSIADTEGVITAETVEGALVEIAKEIDAMDYNVSDVEGFQPVAQGEKVKVTIQQKDGKITNVAVDETALEDALDELEAATTLVGVDAINVDYDETANTVSLKIPDGETVLSQDVNGLKSTISLSYDSATTKIKLTGINGANLGEIDATDFVKDGILQDVVIVEGTGVAEEGQTQVLEDGHRYFRFTYKTVYYDENNETVDTTQVVYLDVESLVDTYIAGNAWIEIDPTVNTISHKTQDAFTGTTAEGQQKQVQFGANTADATADAAGESVEFKVPSFTVDAAGHVTAASEKTVTITLPGSIDTAIQGGAGVDTTYIQTTVVRNATETNQLDVTATAIIGNYAVENQKDGLATTTATKTYVDSKIDALDESTTILANEGIGIRVTDDAKGNDHKYTVNLAEVARVDNPTAEDTEGDPSESSFADENIKFTYVKAVNTDKYGRVTGILTETVTEFFDAGTY